MSNNTASVTDVARGFSDYLNRVAYGGESFVLIRGGRAVAELKGCGTGKKLSELPGILANLPRCSPEEGTSFKDDLRELKASVKMEKDSPWGA